MSRILSARGFCRQDKRHKSLQATVGCTKCNKIEYLHQCDPFLAARGALTMASLYTLLRPTDRGALCPSCQRQSPYIGQL